VSVIIPVKNDADRLALCLDALDAQDYKGRVEVVVVDNGSTDGSLAVAEARESAVVAQEVRPSSYAARNTGVRLSTGSVLAFTDSDCVPSRTWLSAGVTALNEAEGESFIGGGVRVFVGDRRRPTPIEVYELLTAFPQEQYLRDERFAVTANVLVSRAAFERVGPFAEDLISSGDREWGQRAHARGLQGVFAPAALVEHPARRTLGQIRRKHRRLAAGRAQLDALRGTTEATGPAVAKLLPPFARIATALRGAPPWLSRASQARFVATYLGIYYGRPLSALRRRVRRRRADFHG
jgi:glycosyltransferase involved in cell wall biosynthesis